MIPQGMCEEEEEEEEEQGQEEDECDAITSNFIISNSQKDSP